MTDKVVEMVDSVGVLGSGAVAQAIARRCAAVGIPVLLSNSRGPDSLAELVASLGPQTRAATVQEAAQADLVVLAVPFVKVPDVAAAIGEWAGRTVVDATNQFAEHQPNYAGRADLGDQTGSEWVAGHLPGAVLVKAFNAGDDQDANTVFAGFAEALGFAPVLVGGLRDGGRLTQLDGPLSALHVIKQGNS